MTVDARVGVVTFIKQIIPFSLIYWKNVNVKTNGPYNNNNIL